MKMAAQYSTKRKRMQEEALPSSSVTLKQAEELT